MSTSDRMEPAAPAQDPGTLLGRIASLQPDLSKSERKVAEVALAAPEDIMGMPLATLASRAGVSEPTVVRFCRAVGCQGFQDFKLRLAQNLAVGVPFVHGTVAREDSIASMAAKIVDGSIASLARMRGLLDLAAVERAVDLLSQAHKIEFYGHGASGIVARDAQHKFFRLGVPALAYVDPHVHCMSAITLGPGDVAVIISHTGRSKDLLYSAGLAREAGARLVGITALDSPLGRLCEVCVSPQVSEDTETFIPMTSRIADLVVVDILAVGVALSRGPELEGVLARTKEALRSKYLS